MRKQMSIIRHPSTEIQILYTTHIVKLALFLKSATHQIFMKYKIS